MPGKVLTCKNDGKISMIFGKRTIKLEVEGKQFVFGKGQLLSALFEDDYSVDWLISRIKE